MIASPFIDGTATDNAKFVPHEQVVNLAVRSPRRPGLVLDRSVPSSHLERDGRPPEIHVASDDGGGMGSAERVGNRGQLGKMSR